MKIINFSARYNQDSPKKPKKHKALKAGALLAAVLTLSNCQVKTTGSADFNRGQNAVSEVSLSSFSQDYFEKYTGTIAENKELEKAAQKAESYLGIPLLGSWLNRSPGVEKMRKSVDNSMGLINGYIDEDVVQGIAADCWLLTSVENLSRTPEGAKAIYEAISQDDEGNINIYFKGPKLSYKVTQEELQKENGKHTLLSVGDDDMLAIEIAARKFRQDLIDGKIERDETIPTFMYHTNADSYDPLNYGETRQGYWLLAGITDSVVAHGEKEVNSVLDKFAKNPQNSLLDIELKKDKTIKDIDGNKVCIRASHGYGVKAADDETITLICATNSHQEIVIPKNAVNNLPLSDVVYCTIGEIEE